MQALNRRVSFKKGRIVTVQYLLGLNIFVIMELTFATLFCSCVSSWGISGLAGEFYFLSARSLLVLWRMIEFPHVASCVTSRAIPVEFHNWNDSVTRVVGKLRVPTKHSRDILQQAKRIILVESTQIRWFLRWSGRVGWSGRAVAQQRPRVSKLRLKGLSDYHSNETVVEAARQGANGPNKRLL
jgi:hypothetical protein